MPEEPRDIFPEDPGGIHLKIRFSWDEERSAEAAKGFPAGLVVRVLDIATDAFFDAELRSLQDLAREVPELSPVDWDAVRSRMELHRGSSLIIEQVSSESVEIVSVDLDVLIAIFSATVGEAFVAVWKDSRASKKLMSPLTRTLPKAHAIKESIAKGVSKIGPPYDPKIHTEVRRLAKAVGILLKVRLGDKTQMSPVNGFWGQQMVKLPPGAFRMGDVEGIGARWEQPVREVRIDKPFAMGRYPVTFQEYLLFAEGTGRDLPGDRGWGRWNRPVIGVSWHDAVAYAVWLSDQTGKSYRLPSEAEWEYAARSGAAQDTWAGTSDKAELENFAWYHKNSEGMTQCVGRKKPNRFGLYDLSGNVLEWVEDDWHDNYDGAPADASPWIEEPRRRRRVVRGGSWDGRPRGVRSALRYFWLPGIRSYYLGFRLAQDLE